MENNGMVFAAYDGDNAGRQAGRAILADDVEALHEISSRIELGHEVVKRWVQSQGGIFISGGGDEGIFQIPPDSVSSIEQLRNDYRFTADLTMTVGIGSTLSEAGKALMVGKFRGKNTAVQYDPSIEDEIRQARERLEQGTASAEEVKLGEAYLKPETGEAPVKKNVIDDDCPYCKDTQEEDPCPYCQEGDAAMGDDCPFCRDADRQESGGTDDCPFCNDVAHKESGPSPEGEEESAGDDHSVDQTAGPAVKDPTTTSGEDYEGVGLNQPGLDKPQPGDHPPEGLASPAIADTDNQQQTPSNRALDVKDNTPFEHEANRDDVEGGAPQDILAQLDEDGSEPSQADADAVAGMDATDVPSGDNADENVSRPEDYRTDVPGDMGLGEEEDSAGPDLGDVFQEDLDVYADQQQKEKVIAMVSEALEGFKGCKPILEKAKEQAPQLYQSSLAMLRAMIEMAKMLGLSDGSDSAEEAMGEPPQKQGEAEVGDPNSPMPQEEQVMGDSGQEDTHDWNQPFKQHPAHGQEGAAQEDADEDPKPRGQ